MGKGEEGGVGGGTRRGGAGKGEEGEGGSRGEEEGEKGYKFPVLTDVTNNNIEPLKTSDPHRLFQQGS